MEAANNNVAANAEENLDELLDSCLDDFNRPLPKSVADNSQASSASTSTSKTEAKPSDADFKFPDDLMNWGEEFKQFQNVMENFLDNEAELNEVKKMMTSFKDPALESYLLTIKDLTDGAQNVPQMNPDDLARLLNTLDVADASQTAAESDQLPEIMPLMHNIMQKLMSKELLYPSIKEIADKYPAWLSEKKSSLEPEEYERYSQQYKLMKTVCAEFENENNASEEGKKEIFEKILVLMQKIQTYGNPPKELVADIGENIPLDELDNLQIPDMPQQCAIM